MNPLNLLYKIVRRLLLLQSRLALAFDPHYHFIRLLRGTVEVEINGSIMKLDLKHDSGISKDLFQFKKREHIVTDYLQTQNLLNPGDTVLDIGANIGYYALLESKLVGTRGNVYAIEPVSSNYRMLVENIKLNHLTNVHPFNVAAGSKAGEGEIYVASKGNISSLIPREGSAYVRKEKIRVISVDEFIKEQNIRPSLIRMDVEGYEKEIIKGMTEVLRHKPKFLMEVHPGLMSLEELTEMFSAIENAGYTDVVIMYERNELWMNRKGDLKPSLRWITEKIEGVDKALGVGSATRMSIADLMPTLKYRKGGFHAFLL